MANKAEMLRQQTATRRRFTFAFIAAAFACGLLIAWVVPSVVPWLLSAVVLFLAYLCFEARQSKTVLVKRSLPTKRGVQSWK